MTPPNTPIFKMVQNSEGKTVWSCYLFKLVLQDNLLSVRKEPGLDVRIGNGQVAFLKGCTRDLGSLLTRFADAYFELVRRYPTSTYRALGKSIIVISEDECHFIHEGDRVVNVSFGNGLVSFHAGSPGDLMTALLSLTDEYETTLLAGFTAHGVA